MEEISRVMDQFRQNMDAGEDAFSTITYDSRNFGDKVEEESKELPVEISESNLD